MKYDFNEGLKDFNIDNDQEAIWSPFEWSRMPSNLDLLAFSVFFSSSKCFKYLMMKCLSINDNVCLSVICSVSMDLYHLCASYIDLNDTVRKAIVF